MRRSERAAVGGAIGFGVVLVPGAILAASAIVYALAAACLGAVLGAVIGFCTR